MVTEELFTLENDSEDGIYRVVVWHTEVLLDAVDIESIRFPHVIKTVELRRLKKLTSGVHIHGSHVVVTDQR